MSTRIDLSKKYVVFVSAPGERSGLVAFDGSDDCVTASKMEAVRLAKDMQESFPDAKYVVYELVEVV